MDGQQVAIQHIIVLAEERPCTAIATLRDMVRMTGNDDASEASYVESCARSSGESIKCTVTVIA